MSQWIKDVRNEDEHVPMFLVGNKADLYQVVDQQSAAEFAKKENMEYMMTSAKDSTGVNELFGIPPSSDLG